MRRRTAAIPNAKSAPPRALANPVGVTSWAQVYAYIPGISLVIARLVAGVCMHFLGEWRRRQDRKPTALATFTGGATFAFGMTLIRFLMVGIK